MEEEKNAHNSLSFFFKGAGIAIVILSFKTGLISVISVNIIKQLYYTFLFIFIEAIWFGLAMMFIVDLYKYIKRKIL